jgi:folate-dependent phosphoribosylglycinamide formyltransferase PurN
MQEAFAINPYSRDIAAIEHRIHEIEHRLLPRAVKLFAAGAVRVDPSAPRHVIVEEVEGGHD